MGSSGKNRVKKERMNEKPNLLHVGLCVGSESMPKYFDRQVSYSEYYLNGSLIDNLNNLKEVPEYVFLQIQNDKYDGNKSTLSLIDPLKRLKEAGAFIINWTGDKRHTTPSWMFPFSDAVNVTCFSNTEDVQNFKRKGLNAEFLQIGIDEDIFKPEGRGEGPEIVFQANHNRQFPLFQIRQDIVLKLHQRYGDRFGVFGNGWLNPSGITANNQYEEAKVYRGSKIAINCSQFNSHRYTSDRMFRILGCGTFCLSHNYSGIEDDFENDKHLVTWNDINDLMQKIDYWLENDEKRNEIAQSGQKHCYENFTYTNMVDNILKLKE